MSNNRARRWISAAAMAVILLGGQAALQAATQAPAAAALPGAVVTSDQTLFDSQTPKTAKALCPAGTRVTGGGGRVNGARHVVLTRLQPVHTNNVDRFEVTATEDEVGFDGTWAVQAFAICAAPIPGLQIVSRSRAAQSNPVDVARANCPADKRAIGAGGRITDGKGQVDLHHLNDALALGRHVDAVGFEDSTGFGGNWKVTAYVVCVPTPTFEERRIVLSNSEATDSTDRKIATAVCPSGMRVTGGAAVIGGNNNPNVVLESIAPQVFPQGAPGTQLQVIAKENNPTDANWFVRAIAYCHA
jgi:hypothetical protein